MSGRDPIIRLGGRGRQVDIRLLDYLEPDEAERADLDANVWVKSLRHARVDEVPLRARFRYRDDSLWWFAELFLHKHGDTAGIHRRIRALDALAARESSPWWRLVRGDVSDRLLLAEAGRKHGVAVRGATTGTSATEGWRSGLRDGARALFYAWSGFAAHAGRRARVTSTAGTGVAVAAFVHAAFWRQRDDAMEGDEAYVGPVLRALAARLPRGALHLVGIGPRTSYRVRRWSHRVTEFRDRILDDLPLTPVELYASWSRTSGARRVWRDRRASAEAMWRSEDLRAAAVVDGYDLWPLVRPTLTGIAELQFPWSARSMDEAGAALDAIRPGVVVTYAEAGGWGRALILEARRRGIPTVGLQHGFIYRHWLNYLHEPDEMEPWRGDARDRGFPYPDRTLLFDRSAAEHLSGPGHYPASALQVTGSPRLDELVAAVRAFTPDDLARVRSTAGVAGDTPFVLVASKHTQIAPVLPALLEAARAMPDVHVVVKCHPAENRDPYERAAADLPNVTVADASASLAALLATTRLVVTVNSTVAVDAMVLGVPALVLALPNNLSPFVDAGAMAGARTTAELGPLLGRLLYDEDLRASLIRTARSFTARYSIESRGDAADRSAQAILELSR